MADISKIKTLNGTTYNVKDARIPALPNTSNTYLRGDGTWAAPSVSVITSEATITDMDTYLLIDTSSGGGGS